MKAKQYDHSKIEKKWQKEWAKKKLYKTSDKKGKKKCYVLDMFPYPSGEGLHVGHPRGYIGTDIYSRYKSMSGFNVLHPMGWDAFGLPAEQFAIKHKVHPEVAVKKNVKRYKEQLSIIGFNYDWDRELSTTDPAFYKWTQWTFLQMLKKGLAYESFEPINWCPSCQTGLANEDLEGGKCERCGSDVEQKPMRQWVLAITKYADRMLEDLRLLDWPQSVKESQKNWIGRSEGAEFDFKIVGSDKSITVFTTRADTLFGVTYVVLAPEHALVQELKASIANWNEVEKYIDATKYRSEIERMAEVKDKTGIELKGIKVINPANGEEVPVWIADYVLAHYGTGAVMAVPAHDERDFEFAKNFKLPIKHVVAPEMGEAHSDEEIRPSVIVVVRNPRSGKLLKIFWRESFGNRRLFVGGGIEKGENFEAAARREILEETGYKNVKIVEIGGTVFNHYYSGAKDRWRLTEATGVFCELIDDEQVNQTLDEHEAGKFSIEWVSPEESSKDIVDPAHHFFGRYFIDQKVYIEDGILTGSGSFSNLHSEEGREKITKAFGKKKVTYKLKDWVFSRQRYWGEPIPVIHCLTCGVVPVPEKDLPVMLPKVKSYEPSGTGESPLALIDKWVNVKCPKCKSPAKRETNTMPQWAGSSWYYLRFIDPKNKKALVDKKKEKYWSPVDMYVGGTEHATRHLIYARFWHKFLYDIKAVNHLEPFVRLQNQGLIMASDGRKMSKRWGNVINPDDIVKTYGADTLRVYEMFMGPFDQSIAWNTDSIMGARRFLERVWRLQHRAVTKIKKNVEVEKLLHKTIKKVTEDIEAMQFNTAVSAMMILTNEMEKAGDIAVSDFKLFLQLLAPFAPHMTEDLWMTLGEKKSIHASAWPKHDKRKIVDDTFTLVIQVNGKVRAQILAPMDADEQAIRVLALAESKVQHWMEGKAIKKCIYVKGKLVNIVV